MQVKCDQCGTEYAIEESRVPEAGLKGKCTHCGHVFPLRRTLQLDFDAVSKKLEKAAKSSKWRIRKASGEELEFSDLGTLRRWIVQKKVHREDQISKTGDDWKPLGTIVELSKMFTSPEPLGPVSVADLKAKRLGDEAQRATMPAAPSPLSEAPLEVDAEDVLASESAPPSAAEPSPLVAPESADEAEGEQRGHPLTDLEIPPSPKQLRVREDLLNAQLPTPPPPSSAAARALLKRDPKAPPIAPRVNIAQVDRPAGGSPASASVNEPTASNASAPVSQDPFSLRISDSLPGLQPAPMQQLMGGRPDGLPGLPPAATPQFSFHGEAPPAQTAPGGRSFLSGVVTAIAMVGVLYFVYDRFVEPGLGGAEERVERTLSTDDAIGFLDRAAAAYARDTEEGRRVADQAYSRLLELLPADEQRGALARRAHVGRARIALVRADYAQLDGLVAKPYLDRAAAAIAAADNGQRADGAVLLARADLKRLSGAPAQAREALEAAEVSGAPTSETAYLRLALHATRDPAQALKRFESAPSATKALPRFAYLQAVTQQRAGQHQAARLSFEAILVGYPGHVGAQRRLATLAAKGTTRPAQKPAGGSAVENQVTEGVGTSATEAAAGTSTTTRPDAGAVETSNAPLTTSKATPAPADPGKNVGADLNTHTNPKAGSTKAPGVAKTSDTVVSRKQPKRPATEPAKGKTKGQAEKKKKRSEPSKTLPRKVNQSADYDDLMAAANRHLEHGRAREARTRFLAAARKRPSSPEPLANLGWCELELKRTAKAISYFKKSLGRNPRYADALYGLGVAHERNKDKAQAKKAYETYLAVNPRGSKVRMVKRRLDRLR